jgi:tetratricopeptide (TPR) repeat protein
MKNPLNTAEFFAEIKEFDKAKIVLDLLKPYANTLDDIDQLGKIYADIREFNDTLELAHKMFNMVPNEEHEAKYNCRVNIIRAHLNLNQPKEALKYILINEKEKPKDHPNQMDKAMVYFLLNQKDEGEKLLRKILTEPRTKDIDGRVRFNLGTYDLSNGNFKEGLQHVLMDGKQVNSWETYDNITDQRWDGKTYPGKTILLAFEAGIGDEIINIRFQKHIRDRGMNCVWYTARKDLAEVFRNNGFDVVTSVKEFKRDWLWTYGMETPHWLGLDYKDLWYGPYLKAKGTKDKLPGKFKIGIKYSGNLKYDQDLHRTLPEDLFVNCMPEGATLYSFQVYDDPAFTSNRVIPLKDKIKSWDDTLNYLDQMDLVISSCTSLPHLASAMGKEMIVIVPILNYYTWAYKHSKHSAWYGKSTTILRQKEYDNWNAPFEELKVLLNDKKI